MPTQYDKNALVSHIAQGEAEYVLGSKAKFDQGALGGTPLYVRMVIIDVISDPSIIDPQKLSHWEHDLGVSNVKYAAVAPRNSIIAKRVLGNGAAASEKTMVLYPFFPPHLALPSKPGEHVWAMFENPDAKVNEIGYWMCRIVGPHFIEDVNYSHSDRQFDRSFHPSLIDSYDGKTDPVYEFRNGAVDESNGQRFTVGGTASIDGDEKSYESLLTQTDASKQVQYEPVPRFRKRPADVALEGSNNTLIVLGTDRTSAVAAYQSDPDLGQTPGPVTTDLNRAGAGAIDIVAGRGQTTATAGTDSVNSLGRSELAKGNKQVAPSEGDPDLLNDRSRILVSMRTTPDANFGLSATVAATTSKLPVSDKADGSGAIVIKSDKVRLVARQDVVLLVAGVTEADVDEQGRIKDSPLDVSKCASITLRSNGDIIFRPSSLGYIKLGGDDAQRALVCSDVPAVTQNGIVTGPPIATTMGGFFAGAKPTGQPNDNTVALKTGQGTFAAKILVK